MSLSGGLLTAPLCNATDIQKLLPAKQKGAGPGAIRTCTLFVILLYYSPLGRRMMGKLAVLARSHGVHPHVLHLEFLLCELRKSARVGPAKKYEKHQPLREEGVEVVRPRW